MQFYIENLGGYEFTYMASLGRTTDYLSDVLINLVSLFDKRCK